MHKTMTAARRVILFLVKASFVVLVSWLNPYGGWAVASVLYGDDDDV